MAAIMAIGEVPALSPMGETEIRGSIGGESRAIGGEGAQVGNLGP